MLSEGSVVCGLWEWGDANGEIVNFGIPCSAFCAVLNSVRAEH